MSIQSEINRISGNVQDTISAIQATGVPIPSGANSDDLPALAQALANEKQDKLTGQQGQYVGFDSNGAAVATSKPTYTASEVGARPSTWTPTASEVGAIPATEKGAASGVATLGTDGKLTAAQKPAYTASEVGARPSTWTPSAADVGAVPTSRTVNGKPLSSNISLTTDDVGAANPPTLRTATLTTSGWSSNSQTLTVQGVISDSDSQIVRISPADKASATAWAEAGVWCTTQGTNSLTFTCDSVPSANINLNIELQEVG